MTTTMQPAKKRQKKRVLHQIKISEVSAVDNPAQEFATVALLKRADPTPAEQRRQAISNRCDDALADFALRNLHVQKFNPHHSPEDGRFTSGPGGSSTGSSGSSSSTSSSSSNGVPAAADVTPEAKDKTLRFAQNALRVIKITSWAIAVPAMVATFAAALPVAGVGFAVAAAVGTLVTRSALTKAAAVIAIDQTLTQLIKHREAELNKAAPAEDDILRTLLAMKAELQRHKMKETTAMKSQDYYDSDEFQSLVDAEVGRSACPRHVGAQRVLAKYGARPDVSGLMKMRKASDDFQYCVDEIAKRDGCSRTEALRRARQQHPAQFQAFQES